jgi:two-component system response regulator GlrR
MNLTEILIRQIDDTRLTPDERAIVRCQLAKHFEWVQNFEAARSVLEPLWPRVGERPRVEELGDPRARAEVLIRAGSLVSHFGSSKHLVIPGVEDAQEFAKDLISEGRTLFEGLGDEVKALEAQTELAYCYWRQGEIDEARVTLRDALERLGERGDELRAVMLLRYAIVEASATHYVDALRIVTEAEPLFGRIENDALKGKLHLNRGIILKNLSCGGDRDGYADRAFIELTAAAYHFEQAQNMRDLARAVNQLGFLLFNLGRYDEARSQLKRAITLFESLGDEGNVANVRDTLVRLMLAVGQNAAALKLSRTVVRSFERSGERALMADALALQATALARLGQHEEARATFSRAVSTAEGAGNKEIAGSAALDFLDELAADLTPAEQLSLYERADDLLAATQKPSLIARLRAAARRVLRAPKGRLAVFATTDFVHRDARMAEVLREVYEVASLPTTADRPILIIGETGTGKEVLARLIHLWSGRPAERFVALNCAALTESLFESLLFGHVQGAFTDAVADYLGAARQAAGGTLFLDEIGELSLSSQAKLLRFIESREVQPVGAAHSEPVDVRVVAATNRGLEEMVREGRFRADLFYRLSAYHFSIPPLRARPDDIPALAEHLIARARGRHEKEITFTPESVEAMRHLPLPGNVRELQALIERAFIISESGTVVTGEMVGTFAARQDRVENLTDAWSGFELQVQLYLYEKKLIRLALQQAGGSVTKAAKLLGIKHQTLSQMVSKTGRHSDLENARKPARDRKVSIIKKKQPERRRRRRPAK